MILSKEQLAAECAKLASEQLDVLHDGETGLTYDRFHLDDDHQPQGGSPDTGSIIETLNAIESISEAAEYRNEITEVSNTIAVGDRTGFTRPIQ